jgi:type II secretory pathway pseudopilin PulG
LRIRRICFWQGAKGFGGDFWIHGRNREEWSVMMKKCRLFHDERGVTLIEITMAVAIFAGVIGVTAQSLISFYVSIDMQEQRMEGVAACRSVMDSLREKRVEFQDDFPVGLLTWIETQNAESWEDYLADNSEHEQLANQTLVVNCYNTDGEVAGDGDNPIEVHVTTNWLDRKGRSLSATVVSMLTSE